MRFTEDFVLKVEVEKEMEDETLIIRSNNKVEVRARDEGEKHEDEIEREKRQKVEGGGGLLDNLLAKLASPRTTTTPKEINGDHLFEGNGDDHSDGARVRSDGDDGGGGGSEGGDGGGGGGVINIISNLFHKSREGEDVKNNNNSNGRSEGELECRNEESEMTKKVEEDGEGGSSNGGSFIASLVQDVAAPESDEASILIHSVVHD